MQKKTLPYFASSLKEYNCDAALISAPPNLFYLTGTVFSGYIYITPNKEPLFFVRRPARAPEGSIFIRKPEQIPKILADNGYPLPNNIMLENDYLTYSDYMRLAAVFNESSKVPSFIRKVRQIKQPCEIQLLRQSGRAQADCFADFPSVFKPGMSDLDFLIEAERHIRYNGHLGIFRTYGLSMEGCLMSLLSGENASAASPYDFSLGGAGISPSFPFGCSGDEIKKGTTILIDFGGNFNGYMTDMTRVFSYGTIPETAINAHNTAIKIMEKIETMLYPGTVCEDIFAVSEEIIDNSGLREYSMGEVQLSKFVGHGTGIEVNEGPVLCKGSRDVLKEGNIIAIEPKFAIPDIGAAGIEDTFLITEKGPELLTPFTREIIPLIPQ